ncbi:hypothetical protein PHLH8_14120 [Pseudomonas sp. Pc102]|uniref:DUF5064 family protein n=1 Tax=Pseudomonas sp. Pc102 TaxID=2678261 RepID=UPI001BEDA201|nr:DUF5064 family protein [Pseudomonas sp. Pc102]BBP81770.1 hypothetical protein PHLH8_14120 [Pseudomonas sp. Pc102]
MQFRLLGEVDGERFEEAFALHRDTACNFASVVSRIVAKHGLPPDSGPILRGHEAFEAMFEDTRGQLQVEPGEPVDLDPRSRTGVEHFGALIWGVVLPVARCWCAIRALPQRCTGRPLGLDWAPVFRSPPA